MSGTALLADSLLSASTLSEVEYKAWLFPYDRFLRTQPAYWVISYAPPSTGTMDVIETALRGDPFAADLTYGLMMNALAVGDHQRANVVLNTFIRLSPKSVVIKEAPRGP